ncbi:MAG: arylsulfatase [Halioglobus sp.]
MWKIVFLVVLLGACSNHADSPGKVVGALEKLSPPNILLIVADDLGYSDIGAFGGEISTPNLDKLASQGMRLSNFHTGPTCSVSRSMLMSGVDSHIAGLGNMAETVADNQLGRPGYEGYLNYRVDTLAEVLKSVGYHTYMSGKWHLGMQPEQSPSSRGFEQSFALLHGGGSHFSDMAGGDAHRTPLLYRDDGRLIREVPEDFYSTTFYTDRLLSQIGSNIDDDKPFFAYLAYTAPHWPLQAPEGVINKYQGQYDEGYDVIREGRFAAQQKLGLLSASTPGPPRPAHIRSWLELSDEDQRFHARNMEIYAAMVDYMDTSIGRVVEYLRQQGELDNTVIVFMSDNGAEQWDYKSAPPSVGKFAATFDNSPENRGREGSFVFYGPQWAHVSNTPFTRFKGATYEGGIRAPAIVHWPGKTEAGQISNALTYITDWYSTFAELAGADHAQASGKSLVPLFTGSVEQVRHGNESIGTELWGRKAVVGVQFKLVSSSKKPNGKASWELYNLRSDPSEQLDLAAQQPEVLAKMQQVWRDYVSNNNVILPEGPFTVRPPAEKPTE